MYHLGPIWQALTGGSASLADTLKMLVLTLVVCEMFTVLGRLSKSGQFALRTILIRTVAN